MTDIYEWLFGARGKAAMADGMPGPEDLLAPYADQIEATVLPIIAIETSASPPASRTGSQLGGLPWWPAGRAYPLSSDGTPLFLLAQINLEETPPLDPLPRQGLLQFFIGADDHYGCNLDNPTETGGFVCIYHASLAGGVLSDFAFLNEHLGEADCLPLFEPLVGRAMTFVEGRMPVDPTDYRLEKLLPEIVANDDLLEAYYERHINKPAIRLGGYPTFTQDDPRLWSDHPRYAKRPPIGDFALLTIDTTDGIMWGDSGAAQFLADAEDVRRRDFSKVVYNWDGC